MPRAIDLSGALLGKRLYVLDDNLPQSEGSTTDTEHRRIWQAFCDCIHDGIADGISEEEIVSRLKKAVLHHD